VYLFLLGWPGFTILHLEPTDFFFFIPSKEDSGPLKRNFYKWLQDRLGPSFKSSGISALIGSVEPDANVYSMYIESERRCHLG
jgi:hypothetical protein